MKPFLIRLLFRLIDDDIGRNPKDVEKIQDWLVLSWAHPGFRAYIRDRGEKMLKELAGGSGMSELDRPEYIRKIGQRFELLNLGSMARATFERRQKEREQKGKPRKVIRK